MESNEALIEMSKLYTEAGEELEAVKAERDEAQARVAELGRCYTALDAMRDAVVVERDGLRKALEIVLVNIGMWGDSDKLVVWIKQKIEKTLLRNST